MAVYWLCRRGEGLHERQHTSVSAGPNNDMSRREFVRHCLAGVAGAAVAGVAGAAALRSRSGRMVWQIDPHVCVQCGRCETECVVQPSAVKCVHAFEMCGYCNLCFGYFRPDPPSLDSGAENQTCPTGAIKRTFVEDPYYEYTIDEELCVGCGKCVETCGQYGNGSLYMQVKHDLCLDCNECAIARACPVDAFRRVPAENPYLRKELLADEDELRPAE
jgi:Na+-translocating ferredoxin:NAD+ oxidoreductase subunit B